MSNMKTSAADIHPVLSEITARLEAAKRDLERAQDVYDAEQRDWRECPGAYHARRMQFALRSLEAARNAWQETEEESAAEWEAEVRDGLR